MELNSLIVRNQIKAPNRCVFVFEQVLRFIGLLIVGAYRTIGVQFMGGNCKFHPSCSEYAVEAIHKHSPLLAIKLISIRLFKCRPFSTGGYDPVPERRS